MFFNLLLEHFYIFTFLNNIWQLIPDYTTSVVQTDMQLYQTCASFLPKISIFTITFFNVDNSINIEHKIFKFCEVSFDSMMEGSMSRIFYLGPTSYFM